MNPMPTIDPDTVLEIDRAHHDFTVVVGLTHGLIPKMGIGTYWVHPDLAELVPLEVSMLLMDQFLADHPHYTDDDLMEAKAIGHLVTGCGEHE